MPKKQQDDQEQQDKAEPDAAKESESAAQETRTAETEEKSPEAKKQIKDGGDPQKPDGSGHDGSGGDPQKPDGSAMTEMVSEPEARSDQTKCPRCGRYGCPAQRTAGDVQYRKCQHCGFTFKTIRTRDGRAEFRG